MIGLLAYTSPIDLYGRFMIVGLLEPTIEASPVLDWRVVDKSGSLLEFEVTGEVSRSDGGGLARYPLPWRLDTLTEASGFVLGATAPVAGIVADFIDRLGRLSCMARDPLGTSASLDEISLAELDVRLRFVPSCPFTSCLSSGLRLYILFFWKALPL